MTSKKWIREEAYMYEQMPYGRPPTRYSIAEGIGKLRTRLTSDEADHVLMTLHCEAFGAARHADHFEAWLEARPSAEERGRSDEIIEYLDADFARHDKIAPDDTADLFGSVELVFPNLTDTELAVVHEHLTYWVSDMEQSISYLRFCATMGLGLEWPK